MRIRIIPECFANQKKEPLMLPTPHFTCDVKLFVCNEVVYFAKMPRDDADGVSALVTNKKTG